jgi:recombination protein RecA
MSKKKPEVSKSTRVKLNEVLKDSSKFTYKKIEESIWSDIPYFIPVCPWIDYSVSAFEQGRKGGIPATRLIEIYGPESSGKSTLADIIIANVQNKMEGYGIIADYEDAHQARRMKELGIDEDYITFIEPKETKAGIGQLALEDFFDGTEEAVRRIRSEDPNGPIVAVCDALASAHRREYIDNVDKEDIAEYDGLNMKASLAKAKFLSDGLTKFVGRMTRRNVTIIIVNQLRLQPNVLFGDPHYAPGGKTLPYTASLILGLSKGSKFKPDKDPIRKHRDPDPVGLENTFKIVKNKVAKPVDKGTYKLYFDDRGIVWEENFFEMIKDRKIADWCEELEKVGNSWSWRGERIAKSEKDMVNYLINNPDIYKDIENTIFGDQNDNAA